MISPPLGTLTMLLTDVEGSTRLWEEHSGGMRTAIRRHHEIAFDAIDRHGGYRPPDQGEGDSVFAVFADAVAAVTCAVGLQQVLAAEPWPDDVELRVRMALHTGTLELRDGRNYAGPALNRCARLRAIAHGGQAVLTDATRALVAADLPSDTTLRDLGMHRLKDLSVPEHVFQLCHRELPDDFPELQSLDVRPHNLPVQLTRFVGRQDELAEVTALLSQSRLLTLTGSGGCGKTRLALQAAAHALDDHGDGVWLTELAGVQEPALVPRVVAGALRLREQQRRPILDTLAEHLASRTTLLVLDNCEHLVDACARLSERLLTAAPSVTILATSREPLGVQGEVLWRVPSLSLPDGAGTVVLEDMARSEAVQLFLDRALAADPRFALTGSNAPSVARVCSRVEGIPLAIELAAAKLRTLTVQQIEQRLEDRFRLLAGASRTALARHQTLRAAVDWSHELLSEQEQVLLRRLAVFAGGFTLDAAEEVCGGGGIDRPEILDLLSELALKSLVLFESETGEGRYRQLETIREYALEKLQTAAEEDDLRRRHLAWSVEYAARVEPELRGPDQPAWLDRLHAELDNFRAAFEWSVSHGEAEAALGLGSALLEFWIVRADWSEGREWVERALALPGAVDPAIRMKALRAAGELADVLSDYSSSIRRFEESLAVARSIGDRRGVAEALMGLAHEAERVGKHAEARPFIEEAVAIFRELGDEPSLARSLGGLAWLENDYRRARELWRETVAVRRKLGNRESVAWGVLQLGFCAQGAGDYGAARAAYEESLGIGRELGYKRLIARCLTQLGETALWEGDLEGARRLYEESLPIWREIGHLSGLVDGLRGLGDVARLAGDEDAAASFLEESLSVSRDTGNRGGEAGALRSLAALALSRADLGDAEALHLEALFHWRDMDDAAGTATALEGLGEVTAAQGSLEVAARMLAASEALRERVGAAIAPCDRAGYEGALAAAREGLGSEAFETAWTAGGRLELPELSAMQGNRSPARAER